MAYWFKQETKKMTDQLTNARNAIMNVSKYGHGGKAKAKVKLGCFHFQPLVSMYIVVNVLLWVGAIRF